MNGECTIWSTPANHSYRPHPNDYMEEIDSPRAGGKYLFHDELCYSLSELDASSKARLTTWLIKQRQEGIGIPEITHTEIDAAKKRQSLPVSERINQILLFFDDHVQPPDRGIAINPNPQNAREPDDKVKMFYQLLAHSESVGWQDFRFMLDYLEKRQLIHKTPDVSQHFHYVLEVPGFERIEELRKVAPDFDQVFVAMWFDESLNSAYKHGFKQAIDDAGYQAVRIDQGQPFHDKICDKIIREIRRSRFVVADFSKGSDGARGNVYYEAGFAHGLGRRVIFTCREEDENDIQFHTRQYPHILWKDENDLREQLQERITALMGEGPRKSRG